MPAPRLLVVEGNTADGRALLKAAGGEAPSVGYAGLLRDLWPGVVTDICHPADPGANLPDACGIDGYDGVVLTGSALHVYDGGPHVDPQVALARAVMKAGIPVFGSCWGLQVLTVAAGGSVRRNPKGREIGFGRRIHLTPAGRGHPMYAGKDEVFNSVTVHLDEVESVAPGTKVLASNTISTVQAAEIVTGETIAWGVQYHPEYTLNDIAATLRRYGKTLVAEGFFPDEANLAAYSHELDTLAADTSVKWLAWRHALDHLILNRQYRTKEIQNWITHQVQPVRSRRGRE
jgi:GMP synthase (glutamine-hydrolysing)